jgi:hypothetical protein
LERCWSRKNHQEEVKLRILDTPSQRIASPSHMKRRNPEGSHQETPVPNLLGKPPGKWMELHNIILSKVSQAQKTKNHMFSLICGL